MRDTEGRTSHDYTEAIKTLGRESKRERDDGKPLVADSFLVAKRRLIDLSDTWDHGDEP